MKKLIIVIIAVIIIAFAGVMVYPLGILDDPEAQIDSIIKMPSSWTDPGKITVTVMLRNMGKIDFLYARIIDRDLVETVPNDVGWARSNRLAFSSLTAMAYPTYDLPGSNGVGSGFYGQIQAGHRSEGYYHVDDTYDFTIPYMSNHAPTVGEISGPSSSQAGELVNFYCNTYDEDGDSVQVKWDLGDGTISGWGSASVTHTYANPSDYYVRAQPKDSQGLTGSWSVSKRIEIVATPGGYKLTVYVFDKGSLQPLEDAEVKLEECACSDVTDSTGKVVFYNLGSGSYSVSVEKDGYRTFETSVDIDRDIVLTVKLEESHPLPGFEFLTLLIGLIAVIYLVYRKRRII